MVFYRPSVLRGLAITQMVIGALMAVFGVACVFSVDNWTSYVAFGIWVGVWVLIGGILGYVGAKDDSRPNQSLIRCFLGFSVTACIFAGSMFSCYCIAVGGFGIKMRCKTYRGYSPNRRYQVYCYSSSERHKAAVGVGLGSCQLMFAIVESFVAILSSLYCLNAILGRPVSAQLPPAYSVQPAGASPVGMVAVSYAGATMPPQTQVQEPPKDHERPPPYAFTQGGNAPPSASASGAASVAGMPGVMEV